MTPRNPCLVTILLKDERGEPAITNQLEGCGIFVGSLMLVPKGVLGLRLKEEMRQRGLRVATLHPQFPPEETEYLRDLAVLGIRRRVESILKALDEGGVKGIQHKGLMEEVKWIKEVLAPHRPYEACNEVKEVSDLVDVLTSRLIELSKPQVLEVVRIEN